ncbi:AI-2E family transporter [Galbitalea sp. SE-J8]|uniref:AI-2E family transporter n=1 Tax=Galbitalea sp. SE-J8 TaxID=3054952 RepID=UPI00259CC133|nr:AI-2E family transporter [Galbitalea sp. SE-J8]MDM4763401.1 AI-2E family transporter [Galbitalea sp. SE-J8]
MIFRRRKSITPGVPREVPTGDPRRAEVERAIPVPVEIAGQWAWRLLAVAGVLAVLGFVVATLSDLVVPVLVAVLVSALLVPFVQMLVRRRWPRGLAVALAMVLALSVVAGLIVLVVFQVRSGLPDLQARSMAAYDDFEAWLAGPPFEIGDTELAGYIDQAIQAIGADTSTLVNGALSVGTTAGHVLTGFLLVLFTTLFILIDGRGIWRWIVRVFPRRARRGVDGAGRSGWLTLTTFVKVQIFVAFVDAVGIGLGAWIIGFFIGGFPLVIPIAVLVFLASFVPVVGAVLSGVVAVFIALVYGGPLPAVFMLGVVLLVQQVEGHVLQPIVMGTAVRVHPLAVVLSVAGASFIAGIPGALFAVPFVATLNVMVKYIASGEWRRTRNPDLDDLAQHTGVVDTPEGP